MNAEISRPSVLCGAGVLGWPRRGVASRGLAAGDTPHAPPMTVTRDEPGTAPGHNFFTWGEPRAGKSSSFSVAPDAVFGFQHHAIFENPRRIRLFDNGSDGNTVLHPTRVAWIDIDTGGMTASLAGAMGIPGNAQSFGWAARNGCRTATSSSAGGSNPRLPEFSPGGDLLYDATLPSPSYRACKYPA